MEFFAYYAAKFVFSIHTEKKTHLLDLTLCKQPFIVCDLAENIIAGMYVVNRCTFYLLYFIFCANFLFVYFWLVAEQEERDEIGGEISGKHACIRLFCPKQTIIL